MIIHVDQAVPTYQSYAAERTRGLYNVDATDGARFTLDVDLPAEDDSWKIGMVVGPSGSGKSSIAQSLQEHGWVEPRGRWPKDRPVIEVLGAKDYAKATAALSAVGLGSVPSWLRPYQVLSTGEQFRADMAKLLMSGRDQVLVDEFTSVLDRQVAQVAAGAFAKSWRRGGGRIILVTCHYDVLEYVQPDWWIDTTDGLNEFAVDREVIQPRQGQFQTAAVRAGYPGDRLGSVEV